MIEPKRWWCCLNSRERNLAALLIPYAIMGTGYIEKATFDVYWAAFGIVPGNAMYTAFVNLYALQAGEIPNGEEPPIPVYFLDLDYWSQMYTFSLTDDFICTEPCLIIRFAMLH